MQGLNRPGSRESRTQEVTSMSRAGNQAARVNTIEAPRDGVPIALLAAVAVRHTHRKTDATTPVNGHVVRLFCG